MKKLGILLSLLALTYVSGTHLLVMQGVAWSQMLVDYSTAEGLLTGVSKTFDGQHPCSKCDDVQEQKAKQEQAPEQILLKLSELKAASPYAENFRTIRYSSDKPDYLSFVSLSTGVNQQAPPLPPPRT